MSLITLAEADRRDPLNNDYIESQVHAGVLLTRDVEALVLDASYRGTPVEEAARGLPFPLEWHPGYRLAVSELRRHADYRGPEYAELGARIAGRGPLTPRVIGDAARTGRHHLQDLKMVWHTLAGSARPKGRARPAAVPPAERAVREPGHATAPQRTLRAPGLPYPVRRAGGGGPCGGGTGEACGPFWARRRARRFAHYMK